MAYSLNLDPSLIATVKKQIAENERIDKLQEFYYNELCHITSNCNTHEFGDIFSKENLKNIASHVYDGQVFEIIKGLRQVQHLEEKNQYQKLASLKSDQAKKLQALIYNQKEELTRIQNEVVWKNVNAKHSNERKLVEKENNDELRRLQMKIILALDEKVLEQQRALQSAGLIQFGVTTDPDKIKMQMKLLDVLILLGQKDSSKIQ